MGGDSHNLLNPTVGRALIAAASDARCVAVLESLDCSTWTSAYFLPDSNGDPGQPLRDGRNVLGFSLPDGMLPRRVREANTMTALGAEIAIAASEHGARVIAETPACRGDGCGGLVTAAEPGNALVGAEAHVYMFDHPAWRRFASECGAEVVVFDQCSFADHDPFTSGIPGSEKATALIANAAAAPDVASTFNGQRCTHPKGTTSCCAARVPTAPIEPRAPRHIRSPCVAASPRASFLPRAPTQKASIYRSSPESFRENGSRDLP